MSAAVDADIARLEAELATSPTLARRLVDLEAEIAALRDRVVVLERQARGGVDDDATLVRALVGSVGDAVFSAGELVAHAAIDRELATALRGCRTARHVGKRLRALADRVVGGFVLRRIMRDSQGVVWGLQVAPDLHAGPWPREDSSA